MHGVRPAWEARLSLILCCALALGSRAESGAAEGPGARLTRVIREVELFSAGRAVRRAQLNDPVGNVTAIRTGINARAEITFPRQAIARLGQKTRLTIAGQGGELDLEEGLVLFQVPPQASSTRIKTGAIHAAVRGGTGLMERNGAGYVKILILEGEARIYTSRIGESIVLQPGQLLITNPETKGLPEPVHFGIKQLYDTSSLIKADFAPLASRESILREISRQQSNPEFIPTNLIIHGRGTLVNLVPPTPVARKQP